ncbi:MAG: VWA domain-containing protein [Oscillospiraceae bacterium]|nr:VWA domain-containing protein [Oscillospiraceae bacterium]MBQ5514730.1 VWA domain-containing protein [Oscillospiraceae bacterium]
MKNDLTELVFILDKSGSMSGLEGDTVGGFNSMIERQKKEAGCALVTTVLFSNESETVHDRVNIQKIEKLTERDYRVGGCTALLDAIGFAVKHVSDVHRYIRPEDVPAKTMFVITTDGMENASRVYSADKVKKLIEEKKQQGWEFLFLGANIDAVTTAKRFGIDEDRAVTYRADSAGTRLNYAAVGEAVASVRGGRKLSRAWKECIEEDMRSR